MEGPTLFFLELPLKVRQLAENMSEILLFRPYSHLFTMQPFLYRTQYVTNKLNFTSSVYTKESVKGVTADR